jgi:hypothetical protein
MALNEIMTKKLPGQTRQQRFFPSDPFHRLTLAIDQRIYPKILEKRVPPTQPLRARLPFLPQRNKQRSPRPTFCARRQQPKVANGMAVTIGDLVCPQGKELLDRILGWDHLPLPSLVLRQKLDFSFCHLYETALGDWWPPDVTCHVTQELLLRLAVINIDDPEVPFVLTPQHRPELFGVHFKLTSRFTEKLGGGMVRPIGSSRALRPATICSLTGQRL